MDDERWMDLAIEAGQLREALVHRADIEQAKGIVMGIRCCGPDDAYRELSTVSQRANVKVALLSTALVAAADVSRQPADVDPRLADLVSRNWSTGLGRPVPPPPGSDAAHAW